jgi:N-acetylneuraminic acid mutarotase
MKRVVVGVAFVALGACEYPEPADRCDGPCAVYSIDRPIASPGTVITLEGSFDRKAGVQFPGAAAIVPVTSYGSHRVSITVPNDTTSGGLYVYGAPNSGEPIAFRASTFRPELQAFRTTYEQSDVGRFLGASPLFQRTGGAAVIAGGRVYMIGGALASGAPSATIDSMVVNADDTLGDPTSNVAMLTTARSRHASLAIGPYVYAIGGAAAGGATDSVEGAQLDEMLQLGMFGPPPGDVKLTVPREGLAAAVIGNYVWVVGGKNDQGELATLERAPIYEQGLIGTFEPISGIELVTGRSGHSLAVVGNYLYVIGGSNGGTPLNSIERFELTPEGYIGESFAYGQLSTARAHHTSVVVGDSIYVIGGSSSTGAVASVEQILIEDGAIAPRAALPVHDERTGAMLVSSGNHVYLLGGSDETGVPITTFERASIIGHTTLLPAERVNLDNFAAVPGVKLRFPLSYPSTLVLGNTLYVIGGATNSGPSKTVDKAPIKEDGTLGDFTASGLTLTTARMAHVSFVYNNDVYVVGGRTSVDFSTYTASIERAHIGADGSLGPFETLGLTLDVPRGHFTAAVIGRALYVFAGVTNGGASSPTFLDTIRTTELETTTGILAPFSAHSPLPVTRAFHRSLVLSSKVYVLTGKATGTAYSDGLVASIATDGSVAAFGATTNNPTTREGSVLVALGDALFVIGGSSGVMQLTNRSTTDDTDTLSAFTMPASGSLEKQRFGHAAVTIGNRVYVLGGFDGANLLDSFESANIR